VSQIYLAGFLKLGENWVTSQRAGLSSAVIARHLQGNGVRKLAGLRMNRAGRLRAPLRLGASGGVVGLHAPESCPSEQ